MRRSGPTPRATDVPAATRRHLAAVAIAAVLVVGGAATAPVTLARLTDQDTSTISFSTDTLAPPTALAATGTTSASLTWTPSSDAYASGYEVLRSTTSGSGYAFVKTVTPGSATATTDSPGAGHVLLRPALGVPELAERQQQPGVDHARRADVQRLQVVHRRLERGGYGRRRQRLRTEPRQRLRRRHRVRDGRVDRDGQQHELLRTRARTATGSGTSRSASRRGVTSVDGIQVRADAGMNNNGGTNNLCVELSWNGGTSWTAPKSFDMQVSTITTYTLGAANDTWGRTWTGANLSNANFRVRITDASSQPNKTYLLEYLAVQVTYTP